MHGEPDMQIDRIPDELWYCQAVRHGRPLAQPILRRLPWAQFGPNPNAPYLSRSAAITAGIQALRRAEAIAATDLKLAAAGIAELQRMLDDEV